MQITKIEPQQRRKKRVNVFIDGDFAFGLDEDVCFLNHMKEGKEITQEYIDTVLKASEQKKANEFAIKMISYSAKSVSDVICKMKTHGFEPDVIDTSVELLKEYNYLDDNAYAKSFTSDRKVIKKAGKNLIIQELRMKGIDAAIIQEVVSASCDEVSEFERALELGKKKIRAAALEKDRMKELKRMYSMLMRKGYSSDVTGKVMTKLGISDVEEDVC